MDLFVITRSPCGLDLLWRDNFSAALGTSWRASGARGGERLFNELGGGDILMITSVDASWIFYPTSPA